MSSTSNSMIPGKIVPVDWVAFKKQFGYLLSSSPLIGELRSPSSYITVNFQNLSFRIIV